MKNTEKVRLQSMSKSSLKDFNEEEARGWTIDRLREIEHRIDKIIIKYFMPVDTPNFTKVLLHSSVMDIGSKLKVLRNLKLLDPAIIEKIRKLATIRNGFAHAPFIEHVTINIETDDNGKQTGGSAIGETMIEVMTSAGDIKVKSAYEYLVEFWKLNNELREVVNW